MQSDGGNGFRPRVAGGVDDRERRPGDETDALRLFANAQYTIKGDKMKKFWMILAAVLCSATGGSLVAGPDKAVLNQQVLSYHAEGKAVVEMAITKKVDVAAVEKRVSVMLSNAVWTATEYGKSFPKGQKLLAAVTSNLEQMKKLNFKELEHEWHDLNHFSKPGAGDLGLDLKAEENEHFTDPIHSIVHPLLVLKAAQDYQTSRNEEHLKAIKEEMEEGLEQMEKCRDALLK